MNSLKSLDLYFLRFFFGLLAYIYSFKLTRAYGFSLTLLIPRGIRIKQNLLYNQIRFVKLVCCPEYSTSFSSFLAEKFDF